MVLVLIITILRELYKKNNICYFKKLAFSQKIHILREVIIHKYTLKMYFQKKNIIKYLAFWWISIFAVLFSSVYAADSIAHVFTSQSASSPWSNNSVISTDSNLSYINKRNNSSIIWNYFTWYYYDSILGYFNVNW